MEAQALAAERPPRTLRAAVAGSLVFAAIFAAALDWAKWTPYLHRLEGPGSTGRRNAGLLA